MAILVFIFSLILLIAALASAYMSLDLMPTGPGLLYALSAAVAATGAVVTFALGVVARRIGALTEATRRIADLGAADAYPAADARSAVEGRMEPPPLDFEAPPAEVEALLPESEAAPAHVEAEAAAEMEDEAVDPINENRAGHLPTLVEIERAIETPEPPPNLIGRYASGGADYMIFDDGSIEAVTEEGAFKFASMGDFKRFLAERKDAAR